MGTILPTGALELDHESLEFQRVADVTKVWIRGGFGIVVAAASVWFFLASAIEDAGWDEARPVVFESIAWQSHLVHVLMVPVVTTCEYKITLPSDDARPLKAHSSFSLPLLLPCPTPDESTLELRELKDGSGRIVTSDAIEAGFVRRVPSIGAFGLGAVLVWTAMSRFRRRQREDRLLQRLGQDRREHLAPLRSHLPEKADIEQFYCVGLPGQDGALRNVYLLSLAPIVLDTAMGSCLLVIEPVDTDGEYLVVERGYSPFRLNDQQRAHADARVAALSSTPPVATSVTFDDDMAS